MNKIFCVVIGLFVFASCQKSRTCSCSDGYVFTIKASKKTAEDTCSKYSNEVIECRIH